MRDINGVVHPEIGMGATLHVGSDSYPYTIQRISASGKTLWASKDDFRRTDKNGYGGLQEYEYTTVEDKNPGRFSLRRDGYWRPAGGNCTILSIGYRRAYRDPYF